MDKYKIAKFSMEASQLKKNFPPKCIFEMKQLLFVLGESQVQMKGKVEFSRYKEMPLPKSFNLKHKLMSEYEENLYMYTEYERNIKLKEEYYVNFADQNLFAFYGTPLFAQDEIMVAEMPILASVREYLLVAQNEDKKFEPKTRESYMITPCLIRNVERRLAIDVSNIYGNKFAFASFGVIQNAITKLSTPFLTNIIAMEAPKNRSGYYTKKDVKFILTTAYTSFKAAKLESGNKFVIIHTGNWGTGAFGGNKEIMALLQVACAHLAEVDAIYYHTFQKSYTKDFVNGKKRFEILLKKCKSIDDFVDEVVKMKYKWGQSDWT